MKHKMFGQAVSKYTIVLVQCNVMTPFDAPFERLFYEDFNGGFRFKGRVNTCRDILISPLQSRKCKYKQDGIDILCF